MQTVLTGINGLFDLLLLPLSSLPRYADVVALSLISAVVFLLIFKKTSNQAKIRTHKGRILGHVIQIYIYRDQLRQIAAAVLGILKHNALYVGYTLPPLLAILPPLFILTVQINSRAGTAPLAAGQGFILRVDLDREAAGFDAGLLQSLRLVPPAGVTLETPALRVGETASVYWRARVTRPQPGMRLQLQGAGGAPLAEKKVVAAPGERRFSPALLKWRLGEPLLENAEGFLPAGSPVAAVSISYERAALPLLFWRTDALVIYFVLTLVLALAIKPAFHMTL